MGITRITIILILLGLVLFAGCINQQQNMQDEMQQNMGSQQPQNSEGENYQQPTTPSVNLNEKVVCKSTIRDPTGRTIKSISYIKGNDVRVDVDVNSSGNLIKTSAIIKKENGVSKTYLSKNYLHQSEGVKTSCDWISNMDGETLPYESPDNYKDYIGKTVRVDRDGYKYEYRCDYEDFPDEYLELNGKVCTFEEFMSDAFGVTITENQ